MKIAILIEDNYQTLEAWYPYLRLREEEIETVFVGTGRKDEFTSEKGYPAKADIPVKKAKAKEFAGVICPGGYAPDLLRRNDEILNFIKEIYDEGKLVAAICHAGWMLVSTGIAAGKNVTCFHSIKDDLVNAGATYLDQEVVVDGNVITSRNPFDLPDFCREIVQFLKK
jgi:protease I